MNVLFPYLDTQNSQIMQNLFLISYFNLFFSFFFFLQYHLLCHLFLSWIYLGLLGLVDISCTCLCFICIKTHLWDRKIVLEFFTGRINVLLQTQGLAASMLRDSPPATVCLCFKSIKSLWWALKCWNLIALELNVNNDTYEFVLVIVKLKLCFKNSHRIGMSVERRF